MEKINALLQANTNITDYEWRIISWTGLHSIVFSRPYISNAVGKLLAWLSSVCLSVRLSATDVSWLTGRSWGKTFCKNNQLCAWNSGMQSFSHLLQG